MAFRSSVLRAYVPRCCLRTKSEELRGQREALLGEGGKKAVEENINNNKYFLFNTNIILL